MTQVGYGNRLFVQYNVFKPRIASFFKKFLYDVLNKFCIQVYYIVDSKILKIHSEIFSISSLVKISIT